MLMVMFSVPVMCFSCLLARAVVLLVLFPPVIHMLRIDIYRLQISMEDNFERLAREGEQPSIILCDRGLMDGSVYMPKEEWDCLVRPPPLLRGFNYSTGVSIGNDFD